MSFDASEKADAGLLWDSGPEIIIAVHVAQVGSGQFTHGEHV